MQTNRLGRNIANLLARGAVTLSNAASKLQTLQVALLADEAKDTVDHLEPYGFTSNPLPGAEVLAAFIDGDRSHGVVLVASDRRYRVRNLAGGDVAIYDNRGHVIKLTATGIVILANGHPVTVTGGDVIADGISLKQHHHQEHDGPNTGPSIA